MPITADQLRVVYPDIRDAFIWAPAMNAAFDRFGITVAAAQAGALAIWGGEMGGFRQGCIRERLNYSLDRALALFPKAQQFPAVCGQRIAGGEIVFANWIYENLYGNGPESTGDGWKFRGGGINQLTFSSAYAACSLGIGVSLMANTDLISKPDNAALAAVWFMAKYKPASMRLLGTGTEGDFLAGAALNGWADETATQRRLEYWHRAITAIAGDPAVPHDLPRRLLYEGVAPGDDITDLEMKLAARGLYRGTIDRYFGPLLKAAVKAFQKQVFPSNPYEWDGVAGDKTWKELTA